MKFWSATVAAAFVVVPISSAFLQASPPMSRQTKQLFATDPKEFTEYMARAHEEKLKAIQLAEAKKNAEIQVRRFGRGKYSVGTL